MNIFCKVVNKLPSEEDLPPKVNGEDSQEEEREEKRFNRLLNVEFTSQSYASFFNTKMEKDKSILTLSVAGLGFLITTLNFWGSISYPYFAVFLVSVVSFLISIFCVLKIFEENSAYIIKLVKKEDISVLEYRLRRLDKFAINSFYIAITLSVVLGILMAVNTIGKDSEMTQNDNNDIGMNLGVDSELGLESLSGAELLRKSFESTSQIDPRPVAQSTTDQKPQATQQSEPRGTGASNLQPDNTR